MHSLSSVEAKNRAPVPVVTQFEHGKDIVTREDKGYNKLRGTLRAHSVF